MTGKAVIKLRHVPPSTNNLYFNVPKRGRVKTDRYRSWLAAVGWDIRRYHNVKFTGPVYLTIVIGKLTPQSDVSNRIKALEDLLVAQGIIPGDSVKWVRGVNAFIAPIPFEGVEISITEAGMMEDAA